jgi:hypothetical protein
MEVSQPDSFAQPESFAQPTNIPPDTSSDSSESLERPLSPMSPTKPDPHDPQPPELTMHATKSSLMPLSLTILEEPEQQQEVMTFVPLLSVSADTPSVKQQRVPKSKVAIANRKKRKKQHHSTPKAPRRSKSPADPAVDLLLDLYTATVEKATHARQDIFNHGGSTECPVAVTAAYDSASVPSPKTVNAPTSNLDQNPAVLSDQNDQRMQKALHASVGSITTVVSIDELKNAPETVVQEDLYTVLSSCMENKDEHDALLSYILDDDYEPSDDSIETSLAALAASIEADIDKKEILYQERQREAPSEEQNNSAPVAAAPAPSDAPTESDTGGHVRPEARIDMAMTVETDLVKSLLESASVAETDAQQTPRKQEISEERRTAEQVPARSNTPQHPLEPSSKSKSTRPLRMDPNSSNERVLRCLVVYVLPCTYKIGSQLPYVFFLLELVDTYDVDVKLGGVFLALAYGCRLLALIYCQRTPRACSIYGTVAALVGYVTMLLTSSIAPPRRAKSNISTAFFVFGNVVIGFCELNGFLQILVKELYGGTSLESAKAVEECLTWQLTVMRVATIIVYALGGFLYDFLDMTGVSTFGILVLLLQLVGILIVSSLGGLSGRDDQFRSRATTAVSAALEDAEIQARQQEQAHRQLAESIPEDGALAYDSLFVSPINTSSTSAPSVTPVGSPNIENGREHPPAVDSIDSGSGSDVDSDRSADGSVEEVTKFRTLLTTELSTIAEELDDSERVDESQSTARSGSRENTDDLSLKYAALMMEFAKLKDLTVDHSILGTYDPTEQSLSLAPSRASTNNGNGADFLSVNGLSDEQSLPQPLVSPLCSVDVEQRPENIPSTGTDDSGKTDEEINVSLEVQMDFSDNADAPTVDVENCLEQPSENSSSSGASGSAEKDDAMNWEWPVAPSDDADPVQDSTGVEYLEVQLNSSDIADATTVGVENGLQQHSENSTGSGARGSAEKGDAVNENWECRDPVHDRTDVECGRKQHFEDGPVSETDDSRVPDNTFNENRDTLLGDLSLSEMLGAYEFNEDPVRWIDYFVTFAASFQSIVNGLVFGTGTLLMFEEYGLSKSLIGVVYSCSVISGVVASTIPVNSACLKLLQSKLPSPHNFYFFLFLATYCSLMTAMPFFAAYIVGFLTVNVALTLFVHYLTDLEGTASGTASRQKLDPYGQGFRRTCGVSITLISPILYDLMPHLPNIVGACVCFFVTLIVYIGFETGKVGTQEAINSTDGQDNLYRDLTNGDSSEGRSFRIRVNYAIRESMFEHNL